MRVRDSPTRQLSDLNVPVRQLGLPQVIDNGMPVSLKLRHKVRNRSVGIVPVTKSEVIRRRQNINPVLEILVPLPPNILLKRRTSRPPAINLPIKQRRQQHRHTQIVHERLHHVRRIRTSKRPTHITRCIPHMRSHTVLPPPNVVMNRSGDDRHSHRQSAKRTCVSTRTTHTCVNKERGGATNKKRRVERREERERRSRMCEQGARVVAFNSTYRRRSRTSHGNISLTCSAATAPSSQAQPTPGTPRATPSLSPRPRRPPGCSRRRRRRTRGGGAP